MLKKLLNLAKKCRKSINITNDLDTLLDLKIRSNHLLSKALYSDESIVKEAENQETELIVSLTTYNKRIHDVHLIIESIAEQTVKPNKIILWLDETEFSLSTIPLLLKQQIKRGLVIKFCPDYGSYKKLIPTIQQYSGANIITIDDDILYPHDMIELLLKEHFSFLDKVICHTAHKIVMNSDGFAKPYSQWELQTEDSSASNMIFPIGAGGVFYPAAISSLFCTDPQIFLELAPHADDLWFKAMSLKNGFQCKKVNDERRFSHRFLTIRESQDIGLYNTNYLQADNDDQIKAVFEKYDLYKILS